MSELTVPSRPAGVGLVAILTFILGVLSLIVGLFSIIHHGATDLQDSSDATSSQLIISGIVALIFGVIYLAVSRGIWKGSIFARMIVILVSAVLIVGGVYHAFAYSGHLRYQGFADIVWGIVLIALLSTARAKAFFSRY